MPHFECGAFDHSATSPGAIAGGLIRPRSGRVLGEDGGADKALPAGICRSGGKPAQRQEWGRQTRQTLAAPCRVIEILAGSAASLANLSDALTVAIRAKSATRSRF